MNLSITHADQCNLNNTCNTCNNEIHIHNLLTIKKMSKKFYEEIIDNYKKLYETKEGYDTKIYVGEKPNIKEFQVHSFILKIQSKFYKTAFTKDVQQKDGYYILNSNNSPKIFEILLRYVLILIFFLRI